MREPSAKGRRKAATKEEDEEVSNSSSNGSGIPGPAEKVVFSFHVQPVYISSIFDGLGTPTAVGFPDQRRTLFFSLHPKYIQYSPVLKSFSLLIQIGQHFIQVALWLPTTSSREPSMDSSQKAKLLAQLKAIDGDSPYR